MLTSFYSRQAGTFASYTSFLDALSIKCLSKCYSLQWEKSKETFYLKSQMVLMMKKLACYCVGEWDSRQVQTWTSHLFEKGSFSTQLFKPCSLCEDYVYKEKNTLAKRTQTDSLLHHYMDLVYHFAQQHSCPLPILWDQVAESSYCRTSAREDGNSAASNTHVSCGSWALTAPDLLPLPFAALGHFSDCQWQPLQMQDQTWSLLLRSLQIRRSPACVSGGGALIYTS